MRCAACTTCHLRNSVGSIASFSRPRTLESCRALMTFSTSPSWRGSRQTCWSAAVSIPDAASTTPASMSTRQAPSQPRCPETSRASVPACSRRRRRLRRRRSTARIICRTVTPFKGQTQFKGFLTYPLPWDLMVSAVFQNISGPTITANYAAPNAQIRPSLGRDLAACRGAACSATATVPLIAPQTMFDDRLTRLDLRFGKRFALPAYAPASERERLQRVQRQRELRAQRQLRSALVAALAATGWTDGSIQRLADLLTLLAINW